MNPAAAIVRQAAAEGVSLALSPTGTIKATGNANAVNRWLATIRENKPGIVTALTRTATATPGRELFDFAPPADPENDAEAIEERAAIMAQACGMDPAQVLQEARWQADRERAWRAFLRNAKRILDAPEAARTGFLERYQADAQLRYGEAMAATMAGTMRHWITARAAA